MNTSGEILRLPQVTLCAAASVNVVATMAALQRCAAAAAFARCLLLTDADIASAGAVEVVRIAPLRSAADYSRFILCDLVDHIATSHCLIAQWDGFVVDPKRWRPQFLDFDYIGARWPQFVDGHDVGNGGFSLRSRRLMLASRDPGFQASGAEDLAIGRVNRDWLEARGMRFAPTALADAFSAERAGHVATAFGMHGVFNLPAAVGLEDFWEIYRSLDHRASVWSDLRVGLRALRQGDQPWRRTWRLGRDWFRDRLVAMR